jgi:hypothetical protein
MPTNLLNQPTLILHVCDYIAKCRDRLLGDLVSYAEDPVRYSRRIRMLCQLSDYESQIIKKINQFETNDLADLNLALENIKFEIDRVVDIYA